MMNPLKIRQMLCVAAVAASVAIAAPSAFAQFEPERGAGRLELTAMPAGGLIFSGTPGSSSFGVYTLAGALTANINPWLGVEAEIGGGLGVIEQDLRVGEDVFVSARPPRILTYTGNLVVYPGGNDRPLAPYVTGGIGGLTMFSRPVVEQLGVTENETFFTGNVGAGLKWYATDFVGLRLDYRMFGISSRDDGPAFMAREEARVAHRITGGILLTGGR